MNKDSYAEICERIDVVKTLTAMLEKLTWLDFENGMITSHIRKELNLAQAYYFKEVKRLSVARGDILDIRHSQILVNYGLAISDLKETIDDVESAVFILPNFPGFNDIFLELAQIIDS